MLIQKGSIVQPFFADPCDYPEPGDDNRYPTIDFIPSGLYRGLTASTWQVADDVYQGDVHFRLSTKLGCHVYEMIFDATMISPATRPYRGGGLDFVPNAISLCGLVMDRSGVRRLVTLCRHMSVDIDIA